MFHFDPLLLNFDLFLIIEIESLIFRGQCVALYGDTSAI